MKLLDFGEGALRIEDCLSEASSTDTKAPELKSKGLNRSDAKFVLRASLGNRGVLEYNDYINGRIPMAIRNVTRAGVGLVIGIIILAALVFAGLWYVRERGEQARREEAINIAEEQLEAESEQEVAINTNEDQENESSEDIPQTGVTTTEPAATNELPQTGPELASIVGLGVLSFAVASFVHSRKVASNQS